MPDDTVRLALEGRQFEGWKSVRISRSIEAGVGAFELSVSERFPSSPQRRPIRPGERCEVRIGTDVLITGWVDEVEIGLDENEHTISVRGRDAVGDLIDSAPDVPPAEFANVSLLELARALATPFGITVTAAAPVGDRFERVAINPGQRAFEVIEQQCRYRQLLPISDGRGGLLLTRAGTARIASSIVEGQNLWRASANYSHQERHSEYIVKGQGADLGFAGDTSGTAEGRARDAQITRHRPLLIVADQAVDSDRCGKRALWEAITRAARAARARVDVRGWRAADGTLWPLNVLVFFRSPTLGLSGEFLISEVAYSLDESGAMTSLSLVRRDAFQPPPDRELEAESFGFDPEAEDDA